MSHNTKKLQVINIGFIIWLVLSSISKITTPHYPFLTIKTDNGPKTIVIESRDKLKKAQKIYKLKNTSSHPVFEKLFDNLDKNLEKIIWVDQIKRYSVVALNLLLLFSFFYPFLSVNFLFKSRLIVALAVLLIDLNINLKGMPGLLLLYTLVSAFISEAPVLWWISSARFKSGKLKNNL